MNLERITAGINKAEDTGRMDAQIGFAGASRRIFPTALASYLQFCGWIRQETLCDRSSVTFDLRQCDHRGRGHCNSTGRRGSRNSSRHATAQFLTFTLAEPSYLPGTKCLSFLIQPMARNDLHEELRAINRGSG